jgi:hypothetical protein
MLSARLPIVAPPPDAPLEPGEHPLARWGSVLLSGPGRAARLGSLLLTDRFLRFTGGQGLGSIVMHGARPPAGRGVADGEPERVAIPLGNVLGARVERPLGVLWKVILTLRAGGELQLHFGPRGPGRLLELLPAPA